MRRSPASGRRSGGRRTAWGTALTLLARRDLSEGEVRERLRRAGFPGEEAEAAVSRLRARGYLDDRKLALAAARIRAERNCHGPARIRLFLRGRRVPEALVEAAIRETFPEGAEAEGARRALARITRGRRPPHPLAEEPGAARSRRRESLVRQWKARQFRRLVGRGFSREAAWQAVAARVPGIPADPDSGEGAFA